MIPNIFSYATKELSQDAVICWLVACAKNATGPLRGCGLEFIQALMRCGGGHVKRSSNEQFTRHEGEYRVDRVLFGPVTQHEKIDVYFQAEIDGKVVSFVIEDKTHAEMRRDQLPRYLRKVSTDSLKEDLIKGVYFKTGYVFDDEREKAEKAGYSVFDSEHVLDFLTGGRRAHAHEILRQYEEHLARQVQERRNALDDWEFKHGFVQWKFMVRLGQVLQLVDEKWPARWFNRGGSAWTQYPHYEKRGALYWRLDSGKPLRLMVSTKKAGANVLERWDGWCRVFEEARAESGLSAGKFRRVTTRNKVLVRDGTIGAIAINDLRRCLRDEGLDACVARVENLYRAFTRSVGNELS